ncbi:putative ABC transporter-associated repeat protein [Kribbella sp. VKM Ac-2527]|uniref:Putative ABC transporter-associated repeat protein n=1 Tax=Kribbella caucasensis TaxID=2512215 RepID=A0A4R6KDG4_9ACTN|nr:TIGR03773 family transporter-associated surface protein [Kribbella sp. VKM Ac-2527]TDO45895.1 putative ABC transporter-associated repeat protein [Kribbella sp. VKM Ac-2527]
MKPLRTILGTTLLLPTATVLPATADAQSVPPATNSVIADGHVDLGPRFVDGKWTIQLRDDTVDPAVWRPLEDVVIQANSKSKVAVPADPAYAFLGKAGQPVWVIPQVQQAGVVWPGWNTQDPQVASRVDREVTWSLEGVQGPGTFTLFLNSDFGKPAPVFDSRKPFPQQTGIDVNTHVHGNWTFDAQGTYLLNVAMTAKLTDGTSVTDRRTLRLYAGDGDPRTALAATATPSATPSATAGATIPAADDNIPTWWIATGAGAVVLLGAVALIIRRTRRTTP